MVTAPSILSDQANQTAWSTLKTQEKPLLAAAPSDVQVTPPSNLLQKYIDTGASIFKDAAGSALSTLQGAGNKTLDLLSSHQQTAPEPSPILKDNDTPFNYNAATPKDQESFVNKVKGQFAAAETNGVKNPSMFTQEAGGGYGKAIGTYQITEKTVAANSKALLGQQLTGADLLAHPALQERYIEAQIMSWAKQGLTPNQMAAHWRGVNAKDLVQYTKNFDAAS